MVTVLSWSVLLRPEDIKERTVVLSSLEAEPDYGLWRERTARGNI